MGKVNNSLLMFPFNGEQIDPLTAMLNKKINTEIIRRVCTVRELLTKQETVDK